MNLEGDLILRPNIYSENCNGYFKNESSDEVLTNQDNIF
jgi:hypothetical protein